jgi:hypothetical protein
MRPPGREELLFLLSSGNPHLIKRGLQRICDAAEHGRRIDLARDSALRALVVVQQRSTDVLVRRWLYKLIGLSGNGSWVAWLQGQLAGHETDPENLSWAIAALHALVGRAEANLRLVRASRDPDDIVVQLSRRYFVRGPPLGREVVSGVVGDDQALAHQWLSLLFGKDPGVVPREVVGELATSDEAAVSEYAIWAVHADPGGRLRHLSLHPQDFDRMPANVRRWYLRLVAKDGDDLETYQDLVIEGTRDKDPAVREGAALALAEAAVLPAALVRETGIWIESDPNPLVQLALGRVLVAHRGRQPVLDRLVGSAIDADRLSIDVVDSVRRSPPARIFVPPVRRLKEPILMEPVPTIVASSDETVYLLGLDTVRFSERTDHEQFQIFRDVLDALRSDEQMARVSPEDIAVIPTGDGVFLGFKGTVHRLLPLQIGLLMRGTFGALRGYDVRFGVHSGVATWIVLRQGGPQLISHAVNWTARVVNAALGGEILVSAEYYHGVARPARDRLPGIRFEDTSGLLTKHGEPIAAYRVLVADQ